MNRLILSASLALSLLSYRPAFAAEKAHVATCRDGKEFYTSAVDKDGKPSHAGACSGHGGVAAWTDGSPVKSHERKTEYK